MHKQTQIWKRAAWVALLAVLATSLGGCFNLSEQEATRQVSESPLQTPVPTATLPGVIVITPGEDRHEPTWTPFPTWPPPPTPTRRPGPTATPLPPVQPAKDATGDILYVGRTEDKMNATVLALSVDGAGVPRDAPARLSSDAPGWGLVYPSPDGTRLAIAYDHEWGGCIIFYPDSGKIEPLFRKDLDPMGLTFGWHPNSRQVLIRADDNYPERGLWLVDADTGERTILVITNFGSIQGGAVSPDGQKVAYVYPKDIFSSTTFSAIWMVNADGSDPRLIYSGGGGPLAWSPDGSKIAFGGGNGIMVMDADGSNPRSLIQNVAVGYRFRPSWSPDSRTLAVVGVNGSNPLYEKNPANEKRQQDWFADAFLGHTIYLVDVTTGKEHPLLPDGSSGNIDPAWSPDGSQIVFASTRSGASEIWVVNADGGNLRQLTDGGQLVRFPHWRRP